MGLNKIVEKLKPYVVGILSCSVFFIAVYLIGWILNGAYAMHFDLNALQNFYITVIGKQAVDHSINSIFNSPRGEAPVKKTIASS